MENTNFYNSFKAFMDGLEEKVEKKDDELIAYDTIESMPQYLKDIILRDLVSHYNPVTDKDNFEAVSKDVLAGYNKGIVNIPNNIRKSMASFGVVTNREIQEYMLENIISFEIYDNIIISGLTDTLSKLSEYALSKKTVSLLSPSYMINRIQDVFDDIKEDIEETQKEMKLRPLGNLDNLREALSEMIDELFGKDLDDEE